MWTAGAYIFCWQRIIGAKQRNAASLLEVTRACVETAENGKEALEMFRASQPGVLSDYFYGYPDASNERL